VSLLLAGTAKQLVDHMKSLCLCVDGLEMIFVDYNDKKTLFFLILTENFWFMIILLEYTNLSLKIIFPLFDSLSIEWILPSSKSILPRWICVSDYRVMSNWKELIAFSLYIECHTCSSRTWRTFCETTDATWGAMYSARSPSGPSPDTNTLSNGGCTSI